MTTLPVPQANPLRPPRPLVQLAVLAAITGPIPASSALAAARPLPAGDHPVASDTLRLHELQARARAVDPRRDEASLEEAASRLRSSNLGMDRLPRLVLRGDAAYQSETVSLPAALFGGAEPPLDRYAAAVEADWTLWDGGLVSAQREAEDASLEATLAGLEAEVYDLQARVAESFFTALLLQEQERELALLDGDLQARLAELRERVAAGAGIPGDTATLRAEILRVRQQTDAVRAQHASALATMASLAEWDIPDDAVLVLPNLDRTMTWARSVVTGPATLPDSLRTHPAFAALDAQRAAAEQQEAVVQASRRPRLSAFGQVAYGSPGFRQFDDAFHEYWQAGVRVQWQPWEWDRTARQVEELRLRARMVDAREELFTRELLRALDGPARRVVQLAEALRLDDEIIALREVAERQARVRFAERTIPASAWTDARSDVQEARIGRIRHQIERVQAQARYLMTLGVELR